MVKFAQKRKERKRKKKCFVRKNSGYWKLNMAKYEKNVTLNFE